MTTETETSPRVWIGCLACYNAGTLVGAWVDALEASEYVPCERSEFGSKHEEFWVMDHEGFLGELSGECSPAAAQKIAEDLARIIEIAEENAIPAAVLIERANDIGTDLADMDASDLMGYEGNHSDDEDFAYEQADSMGLINAEASWPYTSLDWARAARDLMMDYSVIECEGSRYYFRD